MRGRFAPSPTGMLHFGSLITAVASYCEAKTQDGEWLLRIEDLDKAREQLGTADAILSTLEAFGFQWDGEVVYQSQRGHLYLAALNQLGDLIYPCSCSRQDITAIAVHGIEGYIYPKTCLNRSPNKHISCAYRVITKNALIHFNDAIQGGIGQNIAQDFGDFVLKRADGLFAYQLAVVVDDFAQGITHITRGADLLDSTTRQIYLQTLLGYPMPQYAHLPVAVHVTGEKLSKQTLAEPLNPAQASSQLINALQYLGQNPPADLKNSPLYTVWQWAFSHWSLKKVPAERAIISTY